MKILFCINILFGLLNAIAGNDDVLNDMTVEERRHFFRTEDGSIPEYKIVEFVLPSDPNGVAMLQIASTSGWHLASVPLYPVEDDDLISRNSTVVWDAEYNLNSYQHVRYTPSPEDLNGIGKIEFFQNSEDRSAVTVFDDTSDGEFILGILWNAYIVRSIPLEYVRAIRNNRQNHVHERRSVDSISGQDEKRLFVAVFKYNEPEQYVREHTYVNSSLKIAKREAFSGPRLHRGRRQNMISDEVPSIVYPKILIVAAVDVVSRYESNLSLLRELISQFNFVSMMFRRLDAPKVHLKIAGIIIPLNDSATPYIEKDFSDDSYIHGIPTMAAAKLHFSRETRRFPRNDWDSMVILTWNLEVDAYAVLMAPTRGGIGCEGAVTTASLENVIRNARTLVHALGHIFRWSAASEENVEATESHRFSPLEWPDHNRQAMQAYFRSTAAKCTYYKPEVVPDEWTSMLGSWLTLDGQCDNVCKSCDGYCMQSPSGPTGCSNIGCMKNGDCHDYYYEPLEGSATDSHNGSMLCGNWRLEAANHVRRLIKGN